MDVSGLAGWCTGQLTQGHNSEMGWTPVFWSDLVLWGKGRKHLQGKVGRLFGKWEKTGCSASIRPRWWELFPGLEAWGEAPAMEQELSQQKVIWKKRLKLVCSSEGAAVGRIDPRLTWSASKQQIITSGLLSSPVASWDHQAGFFGWLASALSRPTYSFTNNIAMWLGTQAWKVQSLSSVLSPCGTESQALIGSVCCLFRRVGY